MLFTRHIFMILAKSNPQSKNIYRIPLSCLTGHVAPEKTTSNQIPSKPSLLLAPVVSGTSTSPSLLRRSPLMRTKRLHPVTPEKVPVGYTFIKNLYQFKSLMIKQQVHYIKFILLSAFQSIQCWKTVLLLSSCFK